MKEKQVLGGQAVIEGVMMLSQNNLAIAVRKPNNKIAIKKEKLKPLPKILKLPLIRGIANLIRMMIIGTKAINYSANTSLEQEHQEIKIWEFILTLALSLTIAITLFKFLPLILANKITETTHTNYITFNILDGIIKIAIFTTFIYLISLTKDMKKLFQYHGAEHKTVHCQEAGEKLTTKNVKKYSTLHPRCGTAFILLVLLTSIIIYTLIPQNYTLTQKLAYRIILLPLIAGIAYELLKISAKHEKNPLFKIITWPGIMLQKITTKEPNNNVF